MADIALRKINMKNLHECLNLKLKKGQKNFVASNMYSLAEAKADNVSVPLAIYMVAIWLDSQCTGMIDKTKGDVSIDL